MAINTERPISEVLYKGVKIPLAGGVGVSEHEFDSFNEFADQLEKLIDDGAIFDIKIKLKNDVTLSGRKHTIKSTHSYAEWNTAVYPSGTVIKGTISTSSTEGYKYVVTVVAGLTIKTLSQVPTTTIQIIGNTGNWESPGVTAFDVNVTTSSSTLYNGYGNITDNDATFSLIY